MWPKRQESATDPEKLERPRRGAGVGVRTRLTPETLPSAVGAHAVVSPSEARGLKASRVKNYMQSRTCLCLAIACTYPLLGVMIRETILLFHPGQTVGAR